MARIRSGIVVAIASLAFWQAGSATRATASQIAPPPPASMPVPPPPPPGPFLIWFDWDETEIMTRSVPVIGNAARFAQSYGGLPMLVTGFADRSGPADYNHRLSQLRAERVRELLASHGIPLGSMTTQACGERRPLVETADGVREEQNRRVEIGFPEWPWGDPPTAPGDSECR